MSTENKKVSFLDDVLSGHIKLPMVPRAMQRLLILMKDENSNQAAIIKELEKDPVLSSKALRLANSSFFGGKRSVGSINDAIFLIGTDALHALVITCGAQAIFNDVPGVNLRQFWLSSIVTGYSARQIALRRNLDKDIAYTAGLLQGIGHLILCQCHKKIAYEEFSGVSKLYGLDLAEREIEVFGVNHAQVSALWVSKLGMPFEVIDAIEHSLDPVTSQSFTLGQTIFMSCNLAKTTSGSLTLEESINIIDNELLN